VTTQIKRYTSVLQVRGLGVRLKIPLQKNNKFFEKLPISETGWKEHRRPSMYKELQVGTWNVLSNIDAAHSRT